MQAGNDRTAAGCEKKNGLVIAEPDTAPYEASMSTSANLRLRHTLAAIAALGFFVLMFWLGRRLDPETLESFRNDASPWAFFAVFAVIPMVGVPLTPFFLVAGAAYPLWVSLLGTFLGLFFNLTCSYLIARGGLAPLLTRLLARSGYTLPEPGKDRGVRFTLMLRMIPAMPNFVKNYLLGLAGVPYFVFISISMVISYLYALPFLLLGESVFDQDWRMVAIAVVLLGLFAWLGRCLQKRLKA